MRTTAWAAPVAGGLAAVLILFIFDPAQVPIYPVCQFRRLTGLACPGCGSLRALHALLHGHWVAALHLNLLLVLSLPVFAGMGFRVAWHKIRGKPGAAIQPTWLWLYVAVWVAFGVVRNLPFPACAAFKP